MAIVTEMNSQFNYKTFAEVLRFCKQFSHAAAEKAGLSGSLLTRLTCFFCRHMALRHRPVLQQSCNTGL